KKLAKAVGGGPSPGVANNVKGNVFENVIDSASRRKGALPFFRAARRGGIDAGLLEDGSVVLTEAKFANRLQFDDFTAITKNLKGNAREVLESLPSNKDLPRAQKQQIRETLEKFLAGETPSNLRVRVVTGKIPVGPRLQNKLRKNVEGLPVDFEQIP
ncbi:MAG: hypothetical protein ACRD1X_00605, partial [Vicinamibacteria bacterium]